MADTSATDAPADAATGPATGAGSSANASASVPAAKSAPTASAAPSRGVFLEYLGPSGVYNASAGGEAYAFPLGVTVEVTQAIADEVAQHAPQGHRFAVRDEAAPSQADVLAPMQPPMSDAPIAAPTSYEGGQRGGAGVSGAY